MKSLLKISLVLLLFPLQAFADNVNLTVNARAVILAPMSFGIMRQLDFGVFTVTTQGTISVSQTRGIQVTGGVSSQGGSGSAIAINVMGTPGSTYSIKLPESVTLVGQGGSIPLTLSFDEGGSSRSLSGDTDMVYIDGLLQVAARQAAGTYLGTFPITASY